MIDPGHQLAISRQAQLLEVSRASVYYLPQPTPEADLALMREIDRLHLEHPFAGSRMLRDLLRLRGHEVGRVNVGLKLTHWGCGRILGLVKLRSRGPFDTRLGCGSRASP